MNRILATSGQGYFTETEYKCPENFDDGIIVKIIKGSAKILENINLFLNSFTPYFSLAF